MKYALAQVLPEVPPGGVCAGIDWATADHAVCVVDMAGRVTDRFTAAHDKAGIATLITRLRRQRVSRGRDRAGRRGAGRCAAGRGPDGGGDHLPAGEEPAVPVRRGRRQGRPVRRVRAGGHAAHGPGPAAAAGPGHARDRLAADGGARSPGPGARTG